MRSPPSSPPSPEKLFPSHRDWALVPGAADLLFWDLNLRRNMAKKKKSLPCNSRINCCEEDRLDDLLLKIRGSIEAAKQSKGQLPEKIWIKQQFAIGVNNVTRVLERMAREEVEACSTGEPANGVIRRAPLVPLQAVLLASDVNPRVLTKHVPSLAFSRQVPVIFVKDNRGGSLRLGELVKLKTVMAIGVKARASIINKTIEEVLCGDSLEVATPEMAQQTITEAH